MSRGLPAFFRQFWLHFRKNFKKNLQQSKKKLGISNVVDQSSGKFVVAMKTYKCRVNGEPTTRRKALINASTLRVSVLFVL